ncbi:MAG: hypothetical protein JRG96_05815 [Deltaproteobacteria bacterium]|nr:hypothetical protein [Deltaproteobacteria bacterium]MBW2417058.1 hypothetical protein [Deltaproteobacteria bacterium]
MDERVGEGMEEQMEEQMEAGDRAEVLRETRARLRARDLEPEEIARFFDGLASADRVTAVRALGARDQRRLYEAVQGFEPVRLVELVSPGTADLATVRHYGKNSLPLFSSFEKRFCRPPGQEPDAPALLIGFNYQILAPLTGPGYFVALEDTERGEVLIDYRRLPDRIPVDWPAVQSNERGISRFVYGFMVDTLRRVSEHVTIGSAARHGKDTGNWFVLCRQP